jgi:NADPH2:quinone reductase
MRAVQLTAYGPAEYLVVVDVPRPRPQAGEALIRVGAAGLVFADTQMRRGDYVNLPPSLPFTPGREVAGVIEELGPGVEGWRVGQRVMANMHTGGYAEYARASVAELAALPDRAEFLQGVVYNINLRVAYLSYYYFGGVQTGETILIHAAAGGIGSLLVQIAKRRGGNRVIALASSEDKLAYCRALGADHCINTRTTDYVAEALKITSGHGVDVCFNSVAGRTLETDPAAIRVLGRWMINGYAGGRDVIDPARVMHRSLTIKIFSIYNVFGTPAFRDATVFLQDWLQKEPLESCTRTFPLEAAADAHRWIEERRSFGKIALVP